jgi:hypothetical protein
MMPSIPVAYMHPAFVKTTMASSFSTTTTTSPTPTPTATSSCTTTTTACTDFQVVHPAAIYPASLKEQDTTTTSSSSSSISHFPLIEQDEISNLIVKNQVQLVEISTNIWKQLEELKEKASFYYQSTFLYEKEKQLQKQLEQIYRQLYPEGWSNEEEDEETTRRPFKLTRRPRHLVQHSALGSSSHPQALAIMASVEYAM